MTTALLLVDLQQGMIDFRPPIHQGSETLRRVAALLARARAAGALAVHVSMTAAPVTPSPRARPASRCIRWRRRSPARS
jgi:nicotinamidase-related amidase